MLQGLIALQRVAHVWLYERLVAGAFWEDVKSTRCALEMGEETRAGDRRGFSLSSDCRTVEEQQVEEDVAVEEISLHSAAGSALW